MTRLISLALVCLLLASCATEEQRKKEAALNAMNAERDRQRSEETHRAFCLEGDIDQLDAECLTLRACHDYRIVHGANASTANEKRLARKSGVINVGQVYQNTRDADLYGMELKDVKARMKKAGVKFDPAKCPDV